MKRHATTIVLVLVAGLLALWLWLDRDQVTEGEKRRRENNVFSAWRREELSRIELGHGDVAGPEDAETLVLERDATADGTWRMLAPRSERADPQAVERLLTTLELATIARRASESDTLGLDAPRAFGSLHMGGLVYRFVLGAASPRPEGSSYLRVDDGPPVVVSKEVTATLLAPTDTYRDRTVVPYLSLELARFEVRHEAGGFALEHLEGRSFRVVEEGTLAARPELEKVWGALAELRAEAFPKDADAAKLTARPVLTMKLTPRDGRPAGELVFGEACPGHPDDVVVLRTAPSRVAACAPKGALEALRATPSSLVERRPFTLAADEIEELRLERVADAGASSGPPRVDLARKGTGWRARAPLDRDLTTDEADAVSELVSRIASSDALTVGRGEGDPSAAVARASVRWGEHEETVELYEATPDGAVPVRRLFDGARLLVAPPVARRLVPRATTTRARVLLADPRRVTRVLLRCGAPQELVDRGEGLRLVEPAGFETDGSAVSLVEAYARGKVDLWIADRDDGTFGLDASACRIVLGFEDGNAPVTIVLGAEGEGGIYGTVEGRPGVFVAPRALRELASRSYVSRAGLRVDPSLVASVRVRRPAGAVAPDAAVTAAALREALGALYADAVVATGAAAARATTPSDLEIVVGLSDAGPPKTIRCAPAGRRHVCTASDVQAAFEVDDARLQLFLGRKTPAAGDGGVARDGGPR